MRVIVACAAEDTVHFKTAAMNKERHQPPWTLPPMPSLPNPLHFPEAEFLDEIQTKVLRVSLLAIHSHLYSFGFRFLFLQTHATSYSFHGSVTVQYTVTEKGGKPDRKQHPLLYG
jgi:hypothetical protein